MGSPTWPHWGTLLSAVLCVLGLGLPPRPVWAAPDHVLVVSIDGLSWQRLQPQLPRLPVLQRLVERGTAGPLVSVFPSMTWAAHTAIATGSFPGRNGVLGNRFIDRKADSLVDSWTRDHTQIRVPALWQVAKSAGWTTAALLWPQTSRSPYLDWNVPEVLSKSAFERGSTPGLLGRMQREAGLPASHIGRLGHEEMFLLDSWLRDAAVWLVAAQKPRLLLLHLLSVDTLAHSYGPDTIEARWGLELADRYLGEILAAYERAGLRDRLAVCIVSDHGFLHLTRMFSPKDALRTAGIRERDQSKIRLAINGHAIFVYGKGRAHGDEPYELGTAKAPGRDAALSKYLDHVATLTDAGVEQVLRPDGYAQAGLGVAAEDPNLPDAVILLQPDVAPYFGSGPAPRGAISQGGHGYLPSEPGLWGTFILSGGGVAAGRPVVGMRAIDVAPTLAALVGWAWPVPIDGLVRKDILPHR